MIGGLYYEDQDERNEFDEERSSTIHDYKVFTSIIHKSISFNQRHHNKIISSFNQGYINILSMSITYIPSLLSSSSEASRDAAFNAIAINAALVNSFFGLFLPTPDEG